MRSLLLRLPSNLYEGRHNRHMRRISRRRKRSTISMRADATKVEKLFRNNCVACNIVESTQKLTIIWLGVEGSELSYMENITEEK